MLDDVSKHLQLQFFYFFDIKATELKSKGAGEW